MLSLTQVNRPSTLKENAPLLILCHGYGSDENDLFGFASELPEELFVISLRAPHPLEPYGNAWYAINFDADQNKWNDVEQAKTSRDLISKCIDEACANYPVDASNVTLLGFSQGTILSYAVALTYPEKIKNVIGLSGYIDEKMIDAPADKAAYDHLDIYASHGSVDQVIPVDWARKVPPFLSDLNIKHSYQEFPVGHGVSPQNFHDLKSWLTDRI